MSAELKNNITFFKDFPSRQWPSLPEGYDKDVANSGCLNYKEMNNNFNTLEGRDIRRVYYDSDCTLHIETISGKDFSTGIPCSSNDVLTAPLDFSSMFEEGGCCHDVGHFGWLAPDGTQLPGYNTVPGNTFDTETSIESILRYILVGNAQQPLEVICSYTSDTLKFDYNSSGNYSLTGVYILGQNGCSGTCDISFSTTSTNGYNKTVMFTISDMSSIATYTETQDGITIRNLSFQDGCVDNCTAIKITVKVQVYAQIIVPANVWYAYSLFGLHKDTVANCQWDYTGGEDFEHGGFPLIFKLTDNIETINSQYSRNFPNIVFDVNNPSSQTNNISPEDYESFVGSNGFGGLNDLNPYYFFSKIPNSDDYNYSPGPAYVGILKLPNNINLNIKILIYDDLTFQWCVLDFNEVDPNDANLPNFECPIEPGYVYKLINTPGGRYGACFAINIS